MTESGLFTIGELICKGDQDPDHNAIESPDTFRSHTVTFVCRFILW